MRKNSHDCPGCGFNKAMCQCAGGGAADDEKSKSDAEANATSKPNASADNIANRVNALVAIDNARMIAIPAGESQEVGVMSDKHTLFLPNELYLRQVTFRS